MLTKKDLLFLAILLANQDGLYASDFKRYGVAGLLGFSPYWILAKLVDFGFVLEVKMPSPFEPPRILHVITPAGALAHFNAMR